MKATFDGVQLRLDSAVGWTFRAGTSPHIQEFRMPADLVEEIFEKAKPFESELVMSDMDPMSTNRVNRVENRVKKLTVLGTGPTDSPHDKTLIVADRRWALNRVHVYRTYNIRRKSGRRRRVSGESGIKASDVLIDDVAYAKWSLKGGATVWKTEEVIEDLMNAAVGEGEWVNGLRRGDKEFTVTLPEVENLEIDLPADAAIGQLINALGGQVGITVTSEGQYRLFPKLDNQERQVVGIQEERDTFVDVLNPLVGYELADPQDRRRERPTEVRVMFTRVMELRIDFADKGDGGTAGTDEENPPPKMVNVLPSPEDFQTSGAATAKKVVAGQWIEVDLFLDYLKLKSVEEGISPGLPPFTKTILNKGWLCNIPEVYADADIDDSGLWANRIAALRNHYRVTYQIEKLWRDRIRTIQPYRVSIQDYETGSRAPATVFTNYATYNSWRARGKSVKQKEAAWRMLQNRFANPLDKKHLKGGAVVGTNQKDLKPAPCFARVVDEEQGVIQLEFSTGADVTGEMTKLIRSALDKDGLPSNNPNFKRQYLQQAKLAKEHEVSVILTTTLGAPAGKRGLHQIVVSAEDGQKLLPTVKRGKAEGPPLEVRVAPTMEAARMGWDDDLSEAIRTGFAIPSDGKVDEPLGESLGVPINDDQLQEIAKAVAARVYSRYVDRVEGGLTTPMRAVNEFGEYSGGVRGIISDVRYAIDPEVGMITTATVDSQAPEVAIEALLPPSYRRLIERMVDLKG